MPLPVFVEYDPNRYAALLKLEECANPRIKIGLQNAVCGWGFNYNQLLDVFTDLNMNYGGRYFDADIGFIDPLTGDFLEAFVDMKPLEDAPPEWWRDNFGTNRPQVEILRVRIEAIKRWRAIGSIFQAWCPAEFHAFTNDEANHNAAPFG